MIEASGRHVFSLLLENKSGTLSRVSGLFSARGYNIESLSVGGTDDPSLARMTIIANGTEQQAGQIVKQLNKLVDVVRVMDLHPLERIEREMVLVKVRVDRDGGTEELDRLAEEYGARRLERAGGCHVLELVAPPDKVDAFIERLQQHRCDELARSGVVGVGKGKLILNIDNI